MSELTVRFAAREDVDTILELIRGLARYEREPDAVKTTREDLLRDGFGPRPVFEALLAERGGAALGMALFFASYSTWEGRPGLYLEDLYVVDDARGQGVGRRLMQALAAVALERGWRRLDLSVLDWNAPAQGFYRRLGMTHKVDWHPYRVEGEALRALAGDPPAG